MQKLICSSNGFKTLTHHHRHSLPKLLSGLLHYSTQIPTSSSYRLFNDNLYKRISPIGDPRISIVPILEQWVEEGNRVEYPQLRSLLKELRKYRRFSHALQISQWMSDRRFFRLSSGDMAVRLDLIYKVHGLEKAEEYFVNIPEHLMCFEIYGALLNCYANLKSVEKAEALMQQMRDLGYAKAALSYNVLLNLYSKTGHREKLDMVMEEMKEKGVYPDIFTMNIRLVAYAETSDIDGMEKFLQRMEENPHIHTDWGCYLVAAKAYSKVGMEDKALTMLKKSEGLVTGKKRKFAYESLLSMYAGMGRKDEVYRIWHLYKSSEKIFNTAYSTMLMSLIKLDDIVGAEKIFKEWETGGTSFDFRVPHVLITGYCKKGLLEKAETFVKNLIEKGKKPMASTWEKLAGGFIEADRIPDGVEAMKRAILARPARKPDRNILAACLNYLKEKEDFEGIGEFASLLGVPGPFSADVCERLLDYIYAGKPESGPVNKMDRDVLDEKEDTETPETGIESLS